MSHISHCAGLGREPGDEARAHALECFVCVCSMQSGNETKLVSEILLVKDYTQLYVHINPNYPTLINPT